jgi:hypothetical protein
VSLALVSQYQLQFPRWIPPCHVSKDTVLIVHSWSPACSGIDAPEDANTAPGTKEPGSAVDLGDDWPLLVKVVLVGIVVAVFAMWLRFSRGQTQSEVGYEKTRV